MKSPNEQKVRTVLATLAAKKITTDDAVDVLTRLIGRAFYNGVKAPKHGTQETRPLKKTRS